MSSTQLATIHVVVVNIFLLIYLIKTILLFANQPALDRFTKVMRVPEMIVSFGFLLTGIWLFALLGAIKTLQIVKLVCVFASIPLAVIGFKRKKKPLAVLSLLLIITAYGLSEMSGRKPYIPSRVEINANAEPVSQTGVRVYASNCAMCHGLDGKKMYREASDLSVSVAGEVRVDTIIRRGSKGKMPAFTGILSEEEITEVSSYVRTLRSQ